MDKLITYSRAASLLTAAEKAGQLFMPAAFINDREEDIKRLEELIASCHVGGICFFHSRASAATNYEGEKEVPFNPDSLKTLKYLIARYQEKAKYPLLISIDAEWGLAMRIENTTQFPYAICLGAIQGGEDLIFEVGNHIGCDCRKAGIHWNFAPVADINTNPENPVIGYRSFGENTLDVTKKAVAFMKGLQNQHILTAVKHFPGHGDTSTDSHLGLPIIEKDRNLLESQEFYPFKKAIAEGVEAVMVGHLAVPALTDGMNIPSSVSSAIIKGVLRNDLGFTGVVVSDALNMHSVSRLYPEKGMLEWNAFNAGNDVLCFAEHIKEGIDQILKRATPSQMEEAFERVWSLKEKAFRNEATACESQENPEKLNQKLAAASLTFVKGTSELLRKFRENSFDAVEISLVPGQIFLGSLEEQWPPDDIVHLHPGSSAPGSHSQIGKSVLLALYPPSIKPIENFGISPELLAFINNLIEEKNVVLYLFGNPYVLTLINYQYTAASIVVYQDFDSFQKNALRHFLGQTRAEGKLPVTLKNNSL